MEEIRGIEEKKDSRNKKILFSLIFLVIVSILGIIIKYLQTKTWLIADFFGKNYVKWMLLFEKLLYFKNYESWSYIINPILKEWFYILYTLILIILIWQIVSKIIFLSFMSKRRNQFTELSSNYSLINEEDQKLSGWLDEGLKFLSEGNIDEAELIYESIRKDFDPKELKDPDLRRRIINFYSELLRAKGLQG